MAPPESDIRVETDFQTWRGPHPSSIQLDPLTHEHGGVKVDVSELGSACGCRHKTNLRVGTVEDLSLIIRLIHDPSDSVGKL